MRTPFSTRKRCSSASAAACCPSAAKIFRSRPNLPPNITFCCTNTPCSPPPYDPPRISSPLYPIVGFGHSPACRERPAAARTPAFACANVGLFARAISCSCSKVSPASAERTSCADRSCASPCREGSAAGTLCAATTIGHSAPTKIINSKNFQNVSRLITNPPVRRVHHSQSLLLLARPTHTRRRRPAILSPFLLQTHNLLVTLRRQNPNQSHHPLHVPAPSRTQSKSLRLLHHRVHRHRRTLHKRILRKSRHRIRIPTNIRLPHLHPAHPWR